MRFTEISLFDATNMLRARGALVCPDDRPIVAENFRNRVEDEAEEAHYQSRALCKEDSMFLSTYRAVGLSTGARLP